MPLTITINRVAEGSLVRALSVFATYSDDSSDCGILDQRTPIDRVIEVAQHGWAGQNKCLRTIVITELVHDAR